MFSGMRAIVAGMFLRTHHRRKYGKDHYYFSVVENRRVAGDKTVQREVLYLGEVNTTQEAAWRKTLQVFDEDRAAPTSLMLFPESQEIPEGVLNAVQVKLDQMQLCRPRAYGNCWLGCWLWEQLELDGFWRSRLSDRRGEVPWAKVLEILVINRLIDPGSEFRLHRLGFENSAFDELLQVDFAAAAKDRLYRCLDLLLPHKDDLFKHLHQKWKDLFNASYDVLLYDLTSTYFEGLCEEIPKAKHGYSRDGRPDCRQVSGAGELHPRALPEPDVSVSTHPAPVIPSPYGTIPSRQCANNSGRSRATRRSHWVAFRWWPRYRLYFFMAHRTSRLLMQSNARCSAEG